MADDPKIPDPNEKDAEPIVTEVMTDQTNPRRGGVIADVVAKRREQIAQESVEDPEQIVPDPEMDLPQPAPESAEAPAPAAEADSEPTAPRPAPTPAAEPEAEAAPEPEAAPQTDDNTMVKVSIDGQVQEVPLSSLSLPVQHGDKVTDITGGDLFLGYKTAARGQASLAEANRRLALANQMQAQQQAAPQPAPEAEPEAEPVDSEEVKELYRAMQFGEEEEGIAALQKIMGKPQQPNIDPNQIVDEAASRAAAITTARNDQQAALAMASQQFPEIMGDPHLRQVAARNVHEIRALDLQNLGYDLRGTTPEQRAAAYRSEQQRGTVRPDTELFSLAGEVTQNWVKDLSGNVAPGDGTPTNEPDKLQRKRQAANQVTPASKRSPGAPPERKPLSGPELVQRMRKARGQMVA